MSTIQILLAIAYVGASLQQLLDAFVYAPADVPDYSTTYWSDYSATPVMLKNNLYNALVRNIYVFVYQGYAERNNEGVRTRLYSSKFNVIAWYGDTHLLSLRFGDSSWFSCTTGKSLYFL